MAVATATLCGSKRSFCEEDFLQSSSLPLSKRFRQCPSSSSSSSWVDLFVDEMLRATTVDDAKSRASRLLAEAREEAVKSLSEENNNLKEQGEALVKDNDALKCVAVSVSEENKKLKEQEEGLVKENGALKHAVVVLHQKQRECENKNREMQQLNQMMKEKMRELDVKNYELGLHLKQALQGNSFVDRLPPHVF